MGCYCNCYCTINKFDLINSKTVSLNDEVKWLRNKFGAFGYKKQPIMICKAVYDYATFWFWLTYVFS